MLCLCIIILNNRGNVVFLSGLQGPTLGIDLNLGSISESLIFLAHQMLWNRSPQSRLNQVWRWKSLLLIKFLISFVYYLLYVALVSWNICFKPQVLLARIHVFFSTILNSNSNFVLFLFRHSSVEMLEWNIHCPIWNKIVLFSMCAITLSINFWYIECNNVKPQSINPKEEENHWTITHCGAQLSHYCIPSPRLLMMKRLKSWWGGLALFGDSVQAVKL